MQQTIAKISPPITLLLEICSRNGLTPDYQLLSTEGSVHEPTFKIAVIVGDISAIASGQSKKKARHAAAHEAIKRLRERKDLIFDGINFDSLAPIESEMSINGPSAYALAINEENPVGKLQEVCMKMRVNPPDYDTCDEQGLAHERVFYLLCRIASLNLSTLGQGRSKKLAKRQAAEMMLDKLESSGLYEKSSTSSVMKSKNIYQDMESITDDLDDTLHFTRARRAMDEFTEAINCSDDDLITRMGLIETDPDSDNYFNESFRSMIPSTYSIDYRLLNDGMCLLHLHNTRELNRPLVMASFGKGKSSICAMKNAVINAYKMILVHRSPLIKLEDCRSTMRRGEICSATKTESDTIN